MTTDDTPAAGLLALAERCEAATGPDRALDADIALALGYSKSAGIHGLWFAPMGVGGGKALPCFTASLDSAMTLLDDGWFFHMSRFSPDDDPRCDAHVYPNRGLGDDWVGSAATLPLALCAAALKARARANPSTTRSDK